MMFYLTRRRALDDVPNQLTFVKHLIKLQSATFYGKFSSRYTFRDEAMSETEIVEKKIVLALHELMLIFYTMFEHSIVVNVHFSMLQFTFLWTIRVISFIRMKSPHEYP